MQTLQPENELAVIRKIMEDSRRIVVYDGKDYIVWGILVLVGLLGTYFMTIYNFPFHSRWLWLVVVAIGWAYSIAAHRKFVASNRVRSLAGKILGAVWLSSGISMTIIFLAAITTGQIRGNVMSPLMASILGIANFVSGVIYDHRWAKNLAYGWWAGAVTMFVFPGLHSLLVFSVLMLVLQIIPGIVFYRKWKAELKIES